VRTPTPPRCSPRKQGMPTAVGNIRRRNVELFIVAELEHRASASAATRYQSLQQLFDRLDDQGEITSSPWPRCHRTCQSSRYPPPDDIKRLLANCSGQAVRRPATAEVGH